jgi:hypothetical protein
MRKEPGNVYDKWNISVVICDRYSIAVNQVMVASTLPKGTIGSLASLLAPTLYQGNPDRNHKLWNIVSSERCILHMQVLLECCYI